MAESITIEAWTGGTIGNPTYTDISSGFRFRTDDSPATIDNTAPILIPTSGFHYSYVLYMGLNLGGTFTSITNIKIYSDGSLGWSLGTGGGVYIGQLTAGPPHGLTAAQYVPATGTPGETGTEMTTLNTNVNSVTSLYGFTSASPCSIDETEYTATGRTKCAVLQVKVDTAANGAADGVYTGETYTWQYDVIGA
ncbi:MAG: hypothetical protein PHZ19_11940 [Candidatus Thermoplasmatota archaeon]|nr:hypothetical protein [Candidatus Thermoplasmatota archaeon]